MNAFPSAVDVIEAIRTIARAADTDPTLVSEAADQMSPNGLAEIVRQFLPDGERIHMTDEQKAFWLTFAAQVGPDWIAPFHHVGGFMKKVDEF